MDPLAEYSARRDYFQTEEKVLQRQFVVIGNWRLVIGLLAAVLAWFVFARRAAPVWVLLVPFVAFVVLVVRHQRIIRARTLASRAVAFYQRGIARMKDDWIGRGITGDRFRDPTHVYSEDLDLFGKGGVFELVALTRTAAGEDMLAHWLLGAAETGVVLLRQAAVAELRSNLRLREDIALLAEDVRSDVNVESLSQWGAAPMIRFPALLRLLGILLAICGIAALIGFFGELLPLWPLIAILGCDFAVIFALRSKVEQVLESIEASGRDLQIFSALVGRLEKETFESPRLQKLQSLLSVSGMPASRRIARLSRLTDWLDSSDHVSVRVLRPLVLWREQLAVAFEKWRSESGSQVGEWLYAVAEFETLLSFAALAFERPGWGTPQLTTASGATFEAIALKHPLLPSAVCVPNDVKLDGNNRMFIVSGSNMSGKSTLLRSVGLNAVLAWAGAPVAASFLKVSPLCIGASIRVTDSLQDHRSRFFAEITKIRQIVDLTKTGRPVLFLLDELLSGTNSHDRRIGAAGIVKELLRSNAIGLLTTHDLALANLQQDVSAGVLNVHFEDRMNGTEMLFDYKLKPGVVTRSNAIELMRAVGLDV
jgi:MutS domain V